MSNGCALLEQSFPQLTDLDKAMCDQDITLEECGKSLRDLPNNKAPGSDGFTADFYKFFWLDIKSFVCNSFQYAYQHGILSIDQRRAVLTLLPKANKDIRFLKNWRPLSLLNTDYKILTKLLANRLQRVLPYLISEDQAGCLKNRFIGENIRKIIDIFENTYSKKDPGLAIFIDFEKAFDTVSWQFLFKTLTRFNFGNNFIWWIQTIYNQPLCSVINNGHASDFFEITRGIRQGCPLSALLFIIVAEVMAVNIRNNKNIQGLTFGEAEIKLTQFADDTTLFLKNYESLNVSLGLLEHYQYCAGLKLNKDKSEIVQLGTPSIKLLKHGLKLVKGPIKTLGVWIGNSCAETCKINFDERLKKLNNLLNMWQSRSISIKGKITLLCSQAVPLIMHTASVLYVPQSIIDEVDSIFYKFLWPKGKHHVKKRVIIQDIADGGLKMPDIESKIKSVKLTWVNRLLCESNFSKIASTHTGITNFLQFFKYKNDVLFLRDNFPPFYKQIVQYWYEIYSIKPTNQNDILNEYIMYNKYILVDKKPVYWKKWTEKGIHRIYDMVDNRGKLLSKPDLEVKFNCELDQMQYNSILSAIPKEWKKKTI